MDILMITRAPGVAKFVKRGLRAEGWRVACVETTRDAHRNLQSKTYDLLLYDLVEPYEDVPGFLATLKASFAELPVLILKPHAASHPSLALQGDEKIRILPKPFAFDDLIARIEDLGLLQKDPAPEEAFILNGEVVFEPGSGLLRVGERSAQLTEKECALLYVFAEHPGRTCAKDWLLQTVWNQTDVPMTCPVDETITALRRKLGPHGAAISTVRKYGFRLDATVERTV